MARGGSAVIIRNNIQHFKEEKYATCDIQTIIGTTVTSKQRLTVKAIYCPPSYNNYAHESISLLDKMNSCFIIGGDFNAKYNPWGLRFITIKGHELYEAVTDTGCEIVSTGKPMYWPTDQKKNSRFT
jgi:hypothetical protein